MLENFFVVKGGFFCLCFVVCCCFGMVFLALFELVLWRASMLVCVTFNVVQRDVCAC